MTAQTGESPLAGLRTVVTGASSGIGKAIAVAFSAAGARVGIGFARSLDAAQALAGELPGEQLLLQADLSTEDGCNSIVAEAFGALGNVDVWVNNAGADVLTGDAAAWPAERKLHALVELDLKATIRCSRLAAARMRPGGCILNVGWDHATIDGMEGENPELFAAVKAGVLGFSKSFARSVAPEVRVNVLCPGWIETAFGAEADRDFYAEVQDSTPLRRWGRPEDVAGAAVWLASPAAAFITGQAVNVNGGAVG
ncbi:MAG: SDR family oxidoreductase [Solirubrobacterales bacterium]|nr:SDR family oxidoreductase [Solirubrobacterales bacterium]